jgi:hypothetical protein
MRRFARRAAVVFVVLIAALTAVNLTVARLPDMPSAGGDYITLRGKQIHYTE